MYFFFKPNMIIFLIFKRLGHMQKCFNLHISIQKNHSLEYFHKKKKFQKKKCFSMHFGFNN
jgi:hypothetical protein